MKHTKILLTVGCAFLASCGDNESEDKNEDIQDVRIVSDKTEEAAHEKWKERQSDQVVKNKLKSFEREINKSKRELQKGRISLEQTKMEIATITNERLVYVKEHLEQVKNLEKSGSIRLGIAKDILDGNAEPDLAQELEKLSKEAEKSKAKLSNNPFLRKS